MPTITFVDRDGGRHEVDAASGTSLMEAAMHNSVPGIFAECGGCCSCATCHVYIDEQWVTRLAPPEDLEDGMLEGAIDRRPNSRLSCQVVVDGSVDGLVVEIAPNSF